MKPEYGHSQLNRWSLTTVHDNTVIRGLEAITRNGELAAQMGRLIEATDGLSLSAPVRLNVCCFSAAPAEWDGPAQDALNTKIRYQLQSSSDVVFSPTTLNGRTVIRAAIANLTTGADIESVMAEVARSRNAEIQSLSPRVGYHRARALRLMAPLIIKATIQSKTNRCLADSFSGECCPG